MSPPAGPGGKAPGSSEDTSFYSTKNEPKVDAFLPGYVKSVQSALSDLLTTSATHGTFSRPSTKRGLISIIELMQFTIVCFF